MLSDIAPILRKIAYRTHLTAEESRSLLNVIGEHDIITDPYHSDGLYLVALTFGIMAKGPTSDELYGFLLSMSEHSLSLSCSVGPEDIIDVSGTGGDAIKTFSVGSAASVLLAAGGVYVPKQATRSYTGFCGSADVFREIGLDPFSVSAEQAVACLEATRLTAFHTPSLSPGLRNRVSFLSKLNNVGLFYPTLWHLLSWVYSPFKMEARLYGVFDPKFLRTIAELFLKLGYKRVMVVHGIGGLDEISNIGDTLVAEVQEDKITEWILSPEDCGITRANASDIEMLSPVEMEMLQDRTCGAGLKQALRDQARQRSLSTFFRVLYGEEHGAKRDLVLLNAGAGFYLSKRVSDLRSGVRLAASLIDNGSAVDLIRRVAVFSNATDQLIHREAQIKVGM